MIELAGLLVLGFLAQWLAWRIKVPAILPLISIGLLVGPCAMYFYGTKFINGDHIFEGELLFDVVALSVGLILFEGGLSLKMEEIKIHGSTLSNLLLADVLVTMLGGTVATMYVLDFEPRTAVLFASLIIVTGPTVVGPILRNVKPNRAINTILKWEGILIDPLGALIAILVYEFVISGKPNTELAFVLKTFASTLLIGAAAGAIGAFLIYYLLTRDLVPKYLRNIVLLAIVIAIFSFSDWLSHESGLLAVTVMGMILTNLKIPDLKEIISFNEEVVIILISFLFVMLSSRIDPVDIALVMKPNSLILFLVVILVLRPTAVFLSTTTSKLNLREKLFISWIAPRGIVTAAVASIFTLNLSKNPVPYIPLDEAYMLLPLTFMIIVGTVVLQGLTAKPLARFLKVNREEPNGVLIVSADEFARSLAMFLRSKNIPVMVSDTSPANIREAEQLGIDVYEGSLIDDDAWERIDLSPYGTLFAITPSAEVNRMTCKVLSSEMGGKNVYRLIGAKEISLPEDQKPQHLLFAGKADFILLAHVLRKNTHFQEYELTSKQEYDDFLKVQGEKIIPMFLLKEKPLLIPISLRPIEISKGDKLIYLLR